MHSHDRTMLAKLGFSDPDRREPAHDLAIRHLADEERANALVRMFGNSGEWSGERWRFRSSTHPEFHLAKGEGQYKTTVGFLDLAVVFSQARSITKHGVPPKRDIHSFMSRSDFQNIEPQDYFEWRERRGCIVIEVKTTPGFISDAMRQIGLYAEFGAAQRVAETHPLSLHPPSSEHHVVWYSNEDGRYMDCDWGEWYVLATTFGVEQSEVDLLHRAGIKHVVLGDGFDAYCESKKRESPCIASSPTL